MPIGPGHPLYKNWQDAPLTSTPIDQAALEDIETRVTTYTDNAVSGLGGGGVPPLSNRALLTGNSLSATTVSVKAAPYNPIEAGADPTGAASSTTAMQNTLNSAAGKGELFVPPGTYLLDGAAPVQKWPSNTTMRGVPGKSILKVAASVSGAAEPFQNSDTINGNDDIMIVGMSFDLNRTGGRATGGAGQINIKTTGATNPNNRIAFLNCHIYNSPGLGLVLSNVSDALVQGCTVRDMRRDGMGIYRYGDNVRFIGNFIENCGDDFICSHAIQNNYVAGAKSTNVVIAGNNMVGETWTGGTSGANHINITGTERATIVGNVSSGPWYNGCHIRSNNGQPSTYVSVIGNHFLDAGKGGSGSSRNAIQISSETGGAPPYSEVASSNVENVVISGNIIRTPGLHGVRIDGASGFPVRYVTISNNQMVGFQTDAGAKGISCGNSFAEHLKIANNIIRDFKSNGISVNGANWIDILGNTLLGNCSADTTQPAVLLGAADRVRVAHNRFHGATQGNAVNLNGAANTFVHDNDCQGIKAGGAPTTGTPSGSNGRVFFNVGQAGNWIPGTYAA